MPTCFWILVVSSPTCFVVEARARGPFFLGKSHKEVGNSKGSQIHCAKRIFWEQQRLQDSIFTVRQSFWEQQR